MSEKIVESDFGRFTFLDVHTVVATAKAGENIDASKVQHAIQLIENTLPGDFALILDRKESYSIMPLEVYKYFSSITRLKAIAIVTYRDREFLPSNMEKRIFNGQIEKFSSVKDAHVWIQGIFSKS